MSGQLQREDLPFADVPVAEASSSQIHVAKMPAAGKGQPSSDILSSLAASRGPVELGTPMALQVVAEESLAYCILKIRSHDAYKRLDSIAVRSESLNDPRQALDEVAISHRFRSRMHHCNEALDDVLRHAQASASRDYLKPTSSFSIANLMLAAIVHDLGHGPRSHALELALKRNGGSFEHEDMTAELLNGEIGDLIDTYGGLHKIDSDPACDKTARVTRETVLQFLNNPAFTEIFDRGSAIKHDQLGAYYQTDKALSAEICSFKAAYEYLLRNLVEIIPPSEGNGFMPTFGIFDTGERIPIPGAKRGVCGKPWHVFAAARTEIFDLHCCDSKTLASGAVLSQAIEHALNVKQFTEAELIRMTDKVLNDHLRNLHDGSEMSSVIRRRFVDVPVKLLTSGSKQRGDEPVSVRLDSEITQVALDRDFKVVAWTNFNKLSVKASYEDEYVAEVLGTQKEINRNAKILCELELPKKLEGAGINLKPHQYIVSFTPSVHTRFELLITEEGSLNDAVPNKGFFMQDNDRRTMFIAISNDVDENLYPAIQKALSDAAKTVEFLNRKINTSDLLDILTRFHPYIRPDLTVDPFHQPTENAPTSGLMSVQNSSNVATHSLA